MRAIQPVGPYVDIIDGRAPDNCAVMVRLGVRRDSFQQVLHQKLSTMIAQYYGIVRDCLPNAVHAFRGLRRPLMHAGDKRADQSVLVYSWRPEFDYVWTGSPFKGRPVAKTPLPQRVLVVLVREFEPDEYGVVGSIERWNWIREDPALSQAPVDWNERYAEKLWSRL